MRITEMGIGDIVILKKYEGFYIICGIERNTVNVVKLKIGEENGPSNIYGLYPSDIAGISSNYSITFKTLKFSEFAKD